MLARTDTARLFAFVDQTQITNVASWPGLTSPAPERDSTRTQSCGVTFLGFGLDELGFGFGELGFGLGELGLGLGDVLGVGVVVAGFDEDEDVLAEFDVLGLDEGLLTDLNGDTEEVASVAADSCLAAVVLAAESTVLLGMSGHADLIAD